MEKIASKEKGIPAQTIKDVLNSLVDDDLVDTDKIGTSTYFWSFPGKTYQKVTPKKKFEEKQGLNLIQRMFI